jgi:hypothetical protein
MALADNIRALRDRAVAELIVAHDFYADTKVAWGIVNDAIAAGETFANRNATTGTVSTHVELSAKTKGYVDVQLNEAPFQQFIAIFESFFFDLLRLWLTAYPQNLLGKKVDFEDVLEAADKDAITLLVVNKELNELLYERPAGWFVYLEGKVKLNCPAADEIERIAEAKASRDVLLHNRGVAGKIYLAKAGNLARHTLGQRIDIPEPYHRAILGIAPESYHRRRRRCHCEVPVTPSRMLRTWKTKPHGQIFRQRCANA